jgi:hypothetical protein
MVEPTRNLEHIKNKQANQPPQQGATTYWIHFWPLLNSQLKCMNMQDFFVTCYGQHNVIKVLISHQQQNNKTKYITTINTILQIHVADKVTYWLVLWCWRVGWQAGCSVWTSNLLHTEHTACQPTLQHHNKYNRTENRRQWNAVWPPDDGRKDVWNMLRNNWLTIKSLIVASSLSRLYLLIKDARSFEQKENVTRDYLLYLRLRIRFQQKRNIKKEMKYEEKLKILSWYALKFKK